MQIRYLGKVRVNDIFECQMCGQKGREKYIATPEAATLVDWNKLNLCKKCAKREVGSRNIKKWEEIHEERANS